MENVIFLKGKVDYLGFGKTKKDNKEKYRMTLKLDNKNEVINTIKETFANCPLKPIIVTDETSVIVNIKSLYPFPVQIRDIDCERKDIEDIKGFVEYGYTQDSIVTIKVKCKAEGQIGAIYPVAMVVNKIGSKYDTFADFE